MNQFPDTLSITMDILQVPKTFSIILDIAWALILFGSPIVTLVFLSRAFGWAFLASIICLIGRNSAVSFLSQAKDKDEGLIGYDVYMVITLLIAIWILVPRIWKEWRVECWRKETARKEEERPQ